MKLLKRLKEFLAHLRKKFGDRSRSSFPKRAQEKLTQKEFRRESKFQKKYPDTQDSPQIVEDVSPLTQEYFELKQQVARQNQQIAIQDQRISRIVKS